MASNVRGNLTNYQYVRLGQSISCFSMESIALGYLNIDEEKIKQLKESRRDDTQGFVRDVIKEWACRHPDNQVLLCNAVACPHLVRSGMGTACSRSVSAHLYHAGSRLLPCDGAAD